MDNYKAPTEKQLFQRNRMWRGKGQLFRVAGLLKAILIWNPLVDAESSELHLALRCIDKVLASYDDVTRAIQNNVLEAHTISKSYQHELNREAHNAATESRGMDDS